MATQTAVSSAHATLSVSTVDTINLTKNTEYVEVLNRNGTGELYFTVDGSTPTVAGANTKVVPAIAGTALTLKPDRFPTVVKLISSAATSYSVTGIE